MVDSIIEAVSSSKQKSSSLLDLILPDGMNPIFSNTQDEMQLTNDLLSQILYHHRTNDDGEFSFLNDMRGFNRGGNEKRIRKFETLWKAAERVIELYEGYRAHRY